MSKTTLPRQSTPGSGCKAYQESLKQDGFKLADDCPICKVTFELLCQIGCHPSISGAGISFELLLLLKFLNAL